MSHDETIRKEFARQAGRFGDKGLTLSSQEYLDWMVGNLPVNPDFKVLDVAAGTGHVSRTLMPLVELVVAIDLTPEMLAQASQALDRSRRGGLALVQGDGARLPFPDSSFDLVVSRLAIHHFPKPALELQEMVRACKPGKVVAIMDLLAPSEPERATTYNRLERMRDPSHTRALDEREMLRAIRQAGLVTTVSDARDVIVDFNRWVSMTETPAATRALIAGELRAELGGGAITGMRPSIDQGRLKFRQTWAVVIGIKPS